ncbi:MAG: OsmC family protein [Candidatus Methanofastidiosia archaeon]
MSKEHKYEATVVWTEKKKGIVSFEDMKKETIGVAVAPEFMGHAHIITPEDLYVSSVNSCMMSYVLGLVEKMRIKLISYSSKATGLLLESGIDFVFSKIKLDITIVVKSEKDAKKAHRAIEMSEKGCYISNSIRTNVEVNAEILVE